MNNNHDANTPLDEWSFDDPNEELFFAIGWCDRTGVSGDFVTKIEKACANGADINSFSEDGNTPLTEAILGGMGAPKAVQKLLRLGADPSKRDKNGCSPWIACLQRIDDRVVEDRMLNIKKQLIEYKADRSDEILLQFQNAVKNNDESAVRELLAQGVNVHSPIIDSLGIAVNHEDIEMIKLLLAHQAKPDGNEADAEAETPLITAATKGHLEIVKLLVENGADVTRYAWGDPECTADFLAKEEGHHEVAEWLEKQLPKQTVGKRKKKLDDMNPKFKEVHEKRTNGINCEITNDDVIKKLTKWDEQFTINISNIENDGLTVQFENLPDDLEELSKEIYEFCPDIIDQGYGCMDDMVEMAEEHGHEIPAESLKLIEGIDFQDENFGLKILQRDLKANKLMGFWWD